MGVLNAVRCCVFRGRMMEYVKTCYLKFIRRCVECITTTQQDDEIMN